MIATLDDRFPLSKGAMYFFHLLCQIVAKWASIVQSPTMSEDQNPPEIETKKPEKANTSGAIIKLLFLVGIVFALTKWGLPLMDDMADEFKKKQEDEQKDESPDEKLTSDETQTEAGVEKKIEVDQEDKLKLAIEEQINLWLKKQSPESTATVKFINANDDKSRLAVEYVEKSTAGDEQSKELLFTKDEFGIYIYEDAAGVRQIRVRQPK